MGEARAGAGKIAAVVATNNRRDMLRRCLESLLNQEGSACDVILIDNASIDGTADMVAREFADARVSYLNTGVDIGYIGGSMCGIEVAITLGYDYIWVVSDECLPDATALRELLEAVDKLGGDWGFLCSAFCRADKDIRQHNPSKNDRLGHAGESDCHNELVPMKTAPFVSVFFRAGALRKMGPLSDEHFALTDGNAYMGSVSENYPCYLVPSSKVVCETMLKQASDVQLVGESGDLGSAVLKRPLRVLFYVDPWDLDGIANFILEMIRELDPAEYECSLFTTSSIYGGHDAELSSLGVPHMVVFKNQKPGLAARTSAGLKTFSRILRVEGPFDVVHINTCNGTGFAYARIAERAGVPVRVVHSHNSNFQAGRAAAKKFFHVMFRTLFRSSANVRLACSKEAGWHLFGRDDFRVIPNGINANRFAFDMEARRATRSELGISDACLLVGSIGRIVGQKNPLFQIEVFAALHKMDPDVHYLMVGTGDLEEAVDGLIDDLGLSSSVSRIGGTDVPERYYNAMDVFLLPSLYEGFPFTRLEAQVAGCPILMSNISPLTENNIADIVFFEDLEATAITWANRILEIRKIAKEIDRGSYAELINGSSYSANAMAKSVAQAYRDAYTQMRLGL